MEQGKAYGNSKDIPQDSLQFEAERSGREKYVASLQPALHPGDRDVKTSNGSLLLLPDDGYSVSR